MGHLRILGCSGRGCLNCVLTRGGNLELDFFVLSRSELTGGGFRVGVGLKFLAKAVIFVDLLVESLFCISYHLGY